MLELYRIFIGVTNDSSSPSVDFFMTLFRNPGAVVVHVIRTEGLRGLYRGFVSNATRNAPGEMVFFATYEQARHLVKRSGQVKDDIGIRVVISAPLKLRLATL